MGWELGSSDKPDSNWAKLRDTNFVLMQCGLKKKKMKKLTATN